MHAAFPPPIGPPAYGGLRRRLQDASPAGNVTSRIAPGRNIAIEHRSLLATVVAT